MPAHRHGGLSATSIVAETKTRQKPSPATATQEQLADVWRVVVLNDPVNLMSYVVMVFKKVLGFDETKARKHMLEVHEQGRSVVWSGLREKAEAYAFTLQQWHLSAVIETDETACQRGIPLRGHRQHSPGLKMKRVEVKLNLEAVAPLLDAIKDAADDLRPSLAIAPQVPDAETEFADGWKGELLQSQNDDIGVFLGLFGTDFFITGVVPLDPTNSEAILRACSAVRLRLREKHLKPLGDEALESGEMPLAEMPDAQRRAFAAYVFPPRDAAGAHRAASGSDGA